MHGWGANHFSEKLRSAVPSISESRPRVISDGKSHSADDAARDWG